MQCVSDNVTWRGADLAGKEAVCFDLNTKHIDALKQGLLKVRSKKLGTQDIRRDHFPLRALVNELAGLANEIQEGRGLVVIRGFPIDEFALDDLESIYWGLSTHFGTAVSQSVMGDRLGHVIDVTDTDPDARAYRNSRELSLHTDFADIVSFLCVRKALSGGVNWFASALSVHNEMFRTRPDLLEVLYRGFKWHRYGEEGKGATPLTPWRVPVFSSSEGSVSCRYIRDYIVEASVHEDGQPLSSFETEALDCFEEIAHREGMPVKFTLEPGEAVFVNNFTVLHARTAFKNSPAPASKRLLLRLWMAVPGGRPVVPEIQIYDNGREGGIPPQPGRTPSFGRKTRLERIPTSAKADQ